MHPEMERINECLAAVREKTDLVPEVAVILGTGLDPFGDMIRREAAVPYPELPHFPHSTAPGHKGQLLFGRVEDTPVVVMQGRVHIYEGYALPDVVRPVRLMAALGAKILFVTNASGGIRADLKAGSLMLMRDHISSFVPNPLIGPNISELGIRFPDMSEVYDPALCSLVRAAADKNGIELREGVYVQLPGPSLETPAEIRMLSILGADAVGMSTVVEVIAARHAGMRVVGVSCVANQAAGLSPTPLSIEEVIAASKAAAPKFKRLLWDSIAAMHEEAAK